MVQLSITTVPGKQQIQYHHFIDYETEAMEASIIFPLLYHVAPRTGTP